MSRKGKGYLALSSLAIALTAVATPLLGQVAYVANGGSGEVEGNVSGYTINSTTGALTPIAGSPFAAGLFPQSVAVDPTGRFAYAANGRSNNLSGYTINSTTGALTPIAGSPFAAELRPRSIAFRSCASVINFPIQNLHVAVDALLEGAVLSPGQGNSLNVKLNAAQEHFDRQNLIAAGNVMVAFIDETHALARSTVLTAEQAQPLFAGARLVLRLLCMPDRFLQAVP